MKTDRSRRSVHVAFAVVLAAAMAFAPPAQVAAEPLYSVTIIDPRGFLGPDVFPILTSSAATNLNDLGQVVGFNSFYFFDSSGHLQLGQRGYVWDGTNGFRELPVPAGPYPGTPYTSGTGINNHGQIVGSVRNFDAQGRFIGEDAVLWDSAGMHDLGKIGGDFALPQAINERGQVVGSASIGPHQQFPNQGQQFFHAFLWDSVNGVQDLGIAGAEPTSAIYINESGAIVGAATSPGAPGTIPANAILWDTSLTPHDISGLVTLGGNDNIAFGINDLGKIIGSSYTDVNNLRESSRGFIYDPLSGTHDLGLLSSLTPPPGSKVFVLPADINNQGFVAGSIIVSHLPFQDEIPFVWDSLHGMRDLAALIPTDSGVTFEDDRPRINETGQILVGGFHQEGRFVVPLNFLLTPIPEVPEPTSVVLFASGLVGIAAWRWRLNRVRANLDPTRNGTSPTA